MIEKSQVKQFFKKFWEYPDYPFIDTKLKEYYSTNYSKMFKNGKKILDQNPIECVTFWSEIIMSNFMLKLLNDINSLFNSKQTLDSVENSLKIIKSLYENAYSYLFFITLCDSSENNVFSNIYDSWFLPFEAEDKKAWKLDSKSTPISGKYWVLNKCSLLGFGNFDLKLLKIIKNCDSHEHIIYRSNSIHLIYKQETITLSNKEFIRIASFLKDVIHISIHFYFSILIKTKFFLFICLFMTKDEKYSLKKIPYNLLRDTTKSKSKRNNAKQKINRSQAFKYLPDYAPQITIFVFKFVIKDFWKYISSEVIMLNKYFNNINLEINTEKLNEIRDGSACDFLNSIISIHNLINKDETDLQEIAIEELSEIDFMTYIDLLKEDIHVAFQQDNLDDKLINFVVITVNILLIFVSPFANLINNSKYLTKRIENKNGKN